MSEMVFRIEGRESERARETVVVGDGCGVLLERAHEASPKFRGMVDSYRLAKGGA